VSQLRILAAVHFLLLYSFIECYALYYFNVGICSFFCDGAWGTVGFRWDPTWRDGVGSTLLNNVGSTISKFVLFWGLSKGLG